MTLRPLALALVAVAAAPALPACGSERPAPPAAAATPRDPLASPLFADLTGLPPLLLQCGVGEVLRDDTTALAENAREKGVDADAQLYNDMIHVFQSYAELPAADEALTRGAEFLERCWRA